MFILQQNKKNANNKMWRSNKASSVSVKYSEENSILGEVSYYYLFNLNFNLIATQVGGVGKVLISVWLGGEGGGGERLFEAEHLLTFSAFRMGTYLWWALMRGWALIQINTVQPEELILYSATPLNRDTKGAI